jgi:hypothetical protein
MHHRSYQSHVYSLLTCHNNVACTFASNPSPLSSLINISLPSHLKSGHTHGHEDDELRRNTWRTIANCDAFRCHHGHPPPPVQWLQAAPAPASTCALTVPPSAETATATAVARVQLGVLMGSKFYTKKSKDRIGLVAGSILIHF